MKHQKKNIFIKLLVKTETRGKKKFLKKERKKKLRDIKNSGCTMSRPLSHYFFNVYMH